MRLVAAVAFAFLLLPSGVFAQTITDGQIASIVVTANQVDIDAGTLAAARANDPAVRAFGQQMVRDHTNVNKVALELATKLKLVPEDNATSQSLKTDGDRALSSLRALSGAAFDNAYVDREVAYHQQVIDALDKILIPGAQNAELKALLVKVRPAFVAHHSHAKQLQAKEK
jgi:putative membrane protein